MKCIACGTVTRIQKDGSIKEHLTPNLVHCVASGMPGYKVKGKNHQMWILIKPPLPSPTSGKGADSQ